MPRPVPPTPAAPVPGGAGRKRCSPREAVAVVLVAHLALILLGSAILSVGGWSSPYPIGVSFAASVPFWLVALAGVWRFGGMDRSSFAFEFVDFPLGVLVGVGAQLLVVPALYWPIVRLFDIDADAVEREARRVVDSASGTWGTVILVVMVCLIAPVVEELLYRGLLMGSFLPAQPMFGLFFSAAVFAAFHLQLLQSLGLFMFGSVAGLLVQRTGRLAPAVIAHIAFNSTTVVALLLSR